MLASWYYQLNLQPDFQIAVTHSIFNFEAKVNFNTTIQNDLKWRKTCTGLNFDLEYFNGSQTKFICDSLYKHPVHIGDVEFPVHMCPLQWFITPESFGILTEVLGF